MEKKITGLEKYPLNMNLKTMALITGKEIWQPIMTTRTGELATLGGELGSRIDFSLWAS